MKSETRHQDQTDRAAKFRLTLFVVRFLAAWLGALIVIGGIAALNDINWTRGALEREMDVALNRKCRLGKMKWSYGLNGFSVWTNKLDIAELNGEPFIQSGRSEVGVSVMSLLNQKPVITFLSFDKPVVRLVKTGPNTWNFDDLIKPGPEIKFVQLTQGVVNLFDSTESPTDLEPLSLSQVEMKLNLPKKSKTRPFFVSFELQRRKYSSTFALEGMGTGELEKWKANNYTFELNGTGLNPRDLERLTSFFTASSPTKSVDVITAGDASVAANPSASEPADSRVVSRPDTTHGVGAKSAKHAVVAKTGSQSVEAQKTLAGIMSLLHPVNGLFDIAVKGEGTFDKEIKANIQTTIEGLTIANPRFGELNAGTANSSLTASVSPDRLTWTNLLLKLRGMELHSTGELDKWMYPEPLVKGQLSGKVPDIGVLQDLFKPGTDADNQKKTGLKGLGTNIAPARLIGKAEVKISFEGTTEDAKVTTMVKTRDIAIKDMLNKANTQFPLLCVIGLSSQANIKGDLEIDDQNRIEIKEAEISGPGTNMKANGWVDLQNNRSKLTVRGDRIGLNQTAIAISNNDKTFKQVCGCIKLPGKNSFSLDGSATANATIETAGDNFSLNGEIGLNDASFALRNNSLKVAQVNGKIHLVQNSGGGTMTFTGVKGKMGEGKFELDGKISMTRSPQVKLDLHASSLDLKHLSALMSLFQIQIPVLTERQLYGKVEDVVLKVTGTPAQPNIYFSAVPEDLYYKPPGLAKPVRADAGTIVYDNDQLTLREVQIVSNGKMIVTSMTIDRVSRECLLRRVKAKSDNIELADIHYYLSSTAMPPPLRKAYLEFLHDYRIKNMHGKAYGDILCLINNPSDVKFDGILGCYKAGATVFGYPITKIEGIFAASGEELLLQDLTGYVRGSKFSLDGYVSNYRSKTPSWKTELAATLAPQELIDLIPSLTQAVKASRIEVKSHGPLAMRAKVQGDFTSNQVQYSLISSKDNKMIIQGKFGKLYQPANTPVTVDGVVTLDKTGAILTNTHLLVSDTFIKLDGQVTYAVHNANENSPTKVKMKFEVPENAPVKTLLGMIDPALAKNMDGTVGGSVTMDGDIDNPVMVSDIAFTNLSEDTLKISNMTGRLKGGGSLEKDSQSDKFVFKPAPSIVEVDTVKIKKLPITNLKANVSLTARQKGQAGPSIMIDDGHARIADGEMTFDAKINPDGNSIWAKATIKKISAARVVDELLESPNEMTGMGSSEIEIRTKGEDMHELIKNLEGEGKIVVEDGEVARFGHLQTRITQYNLLTQGIFGFNLNNLVQSVWPVRSGSFKNILNHFAINDGVIKFDEIRFNGDDMRLWGAGEANLQTNKITLEMAGKIPRVANSRLSGSLGAMSRNITLQKAMKFVTFGKLQTLPSLPVLGELATDKPRTFTFNVDSTLEDAKLIARSIEKSFKWLPNKPDATAHPVPAIELQTN